MYSLNLRPLIYFMIADTSLPLHRKPKNGQKIRANRQILRKRLPQRERE
jgi:hypothetical protein